MRNNNSITFPQRTTFSPVLKTVLFAHVHLRNHAANLLLSSSSTIKLTNPLGKVNVFSGDILQIHVSALMSVPQLNMNHIFNILLIKKRPSSLTKALS